MKVYYHISKIDIQLTVKWWVYLFCCKLLLHGYKWFSRLGNDGLSWFYEWHSLSVQDMILCMLWLWHTLPVITIFLTFLFVLYCIVAQGFSLFNVWDSWPHIFSESYIFLTFGLSCVQPFFSSILLWLYFSPQVQYSFCVLFGFLCPIITLLFSDEHLFVFHPHLGCLLSHCLASLPCRTSVSWSLHCWSFSDSWRVLLLAPFCCCRIFAVLMVCLPECCVSAVCWMFPFFQLYWLAQVWRCGWFCICL